jgi:flagellar motility protein MotE (MotC chaperone)
MIRLLDPRLLLPSIIFLGVLTLSLRVSDVWQDVTTGKFSASTAHAETNTEAPKPDAAPSPPAPSPADTTPSSVPPSASEGAAPSADAGAPDTKDTEEITPAEMEVLKQLAARRDELDKRAKDLDRREELTKVAEQRLDQKFKEMETLRVQLQTMVDQINGAQSAQLENLVKIYETMKPEDAAKIFENLDMPILLGVIQRMKPKSTAPIMAKMAPDKAKELTVALTKQGQLPAPK